MNLFPTLAEREERTLARAAEELAKIRSAEPGDRRCAQTLAALEFLDSHREEMASRRIQFAQDYSALGWELLNCGRRSDALRSFDRAIALDPVNPDRWSDKATALTAAEDPAAAMAPLVRAIELSPGVATLRLQLGDVLGRTGRAGESAAAYLQALELDPGLLEAYDRLLAADPRNREIAVKKGSALLAAQRIDAALAVFDHVLESDPASIPARLGRARALDGLHRSELALREVDLVVAERPDDAGARSLRGEVLERAGRLDEALHAYDQAIRLLPDGKALWRWRARVLHALQRDREALTSIDRAITVDAKDAGLWYDRGGIAAAAGSDTEALASFEQVLLLDTHHRGAALGKARVLRSSGDLLGAAEYLDKALEVRATADVLVERAVISRELSHPEDTVDLCDRALSLDPALAAAELEKSHALLMLGSHDQAAASAARYAERQSADPAGWLVLGEARLALRDWAGARAAAERAAAAAPASDAATQMLRRSQEAARQDAVEQASRMYLALELELRRAPSKEEAFAKGIPFELLEEVARFVEGYETVDVAGLPQQQWQELETRSVRALAAFGREPDELHFADVTKALPELTTAEAKRLHGYIRSIVEHGVDLAPALDPILETRSRMALAVPEKERTVGHLARHLHVGIHEASEIVAVLKALRGGKVRFRKEADLRKALKTQQRHAPRPESEAAIAGSVATMVAEHAGTPAMLTAIRAEIPPGGLEVPRVEVDADRYLTQVLGHPHRPAGRRTRAPRSSTPTAEGGSPPNRRRRSPAPPAEEPATVPHEDEGSDPPTGEEHPLEDRASPPGPEGAEPEGPTSTQQGASPRRRSRRRLPTTLEEPAEEGSGDDGDDESATSEPAGSPHDFTVESSPTGESLTAAPDEPEEGALLGVSWDEVKKRRSAASGGGSEATPPPRRRKAPAAPRTPAPAEEPAHEELKPTEPPALPEEEDHGEPTDPGPEGIPAAVTEHRPSRATSRRRSPTWRDSL